MQIVLLTAIHGRHNISSLMLAHYANMRNLLPYELKIVAVMSPDDITRMAGVCDYSGCDWMVSANYPVSVKWQAGLHYVKTLYPKCDAVTIYGSDDFASLGYMRACQGALATSRGFGPDLVHFLDGSSGQVARWDTRPTGIPAGAGRVFSRDLLQQVNWCLWPEARSSGLDSLCSRVLGRHGVKLDFVPMAKTDKAYIIDVKTGKNIHHWRDFGFQDIVSAEEAKHITESCGLAIQAA
jgi:hypothetical protein